MPRMSTALPLDDASPLILGAGPAGLAVAAALRQRGVASRVLEQAGAVGASWRGHYVRLHLHTVKTHSALPGLPFPDDAPRYVSRQGVVDYLERYAAHHGLQPFTGQRVTRVGREGAAWAVHTAAGPVWRGPAVVIATGANRVPREPSLPGAAVFGGALLHSRAYRDAAPWAGRRVLVVGMGNTGAEIALDLAEGGAAVTLSVRSPVNIVRRDVLGRPTQLSSIALARLPPALGHRLARWLRDWTVGDLSRWGLRQPAMSPLQQLREDGKTPVIDLGTVAAIRRGAIAVRPGIATLTATGVRFTDGREDPFDAVILATGYDAALTELLPDLPLDLDARGMPRAPVGSGPLAGLCFVGFDVRQPGGLLRTIGQQAEAVAAHLARSLVAAA